MTRLKNLETIKQIGINDAILASWWCHSRALQMNTFAAEFLSFPQADPPNIKASDHLATPLELNGEKLMVEGVVRETTNGNCFTISA